MMSSRRLWEARWEASAQPQQVERRGPSRCQTESAAHQRVLGGVRRSRRDRPSYHSAAVLRRPYGEKQVEGDACDVEGIFVLHSKLLLWQHQGHDLGDSSKPLPLSPEGNILSPLQAFRFLLWSSLPIQSKRDLVAKSQSAKRSPSFGAS